MRDMIESIMETVLIMRKSSNVLPDTLLIPYSEWDELRANSNFLRHVVVNNDTSINVLGLRVIVTNAVKTFEVAHCKAGR
jgi:hypothetical protein